MPPNLTDRIMLTKNVCYTNAMYHQEESSSMRAICSQTTKPDNIKDLYTKCSISIALHKLCCYQILTNKV